MATPKRRRARSRPIRGQRHLTPKHTYTHGATGSTRPAKDDTYLLDGPDGQPVPHRFDGKCHPDCENVR
jgi:hypothetical protein